MGFIDTEQEREIAATMKQNDYGRYLREVADEAECHGARQPGMH